MCKLVFKLRYPNLEGSLFLLQSARYLFLDCRLPLNDLSFDLIEDLADL